jgi:catechol 2,3-dioxygenase-like lactoylglutathione lyase family enzyme
VTTVAKLRHLAIATDDPDATAQFYVDSFEFSRVTEVDAAWGFGHVLTDGSISLSILKYLDNSAAGAERGAAFVGLHHIGFEVDDVAQFADRVEAALGSARRDISDALGIPRDASIKEYEGFDGVVFDLGGPSVWNVDPSAAARRGPMS